MTAEIKPADSSFTPEWFSVSSDTMKRLLKTCARLVATVGLMVAGGCGQGLIANDHTTLVANEDSAAFLDRISSQTHVSENDAMRGLIMLLDGSDRLETFRQRVDELKSRDIVSLNWNVDAARPVTRGRLAYMIYQAARLPGGVMLTLTGPSERYCLRELQYRGLMGEGAAFTPVTGLEFVGVLSAADTYMRTGEVPDKAGEPMN